MVLTTLVVAGETSLDTVKTLYPKGNLARVYTVQHGTDVKEGWSVSYHPDGKIAIKAFYRNGLLEGTFSSY